MRASEPTEGNTWSAAGCRETQLPPGAVVYEPSSWLLLGFALAAVGFSGSRRFSELQPSQRSAQSRDAVLVRAGAMSDYQALWFPRKNASQCRAGDSSIDARGDDRRDQTRTMRPDPCELRRRGHRTGRGSRPCARSRRACSAAWPEYSQRGSGTAHAPRPRASP